ncbi:MAG TPA: NnrU family protein [Ferruginibacter sp.]|nr:NnrU family protein [Ferruginibacter sp.]
MLKIHLLLSLLWLAYCLFHSLLANARVKTFVYSRLKLSATTYRLLYNIIALGLLFAVWFFHRGVKSPVLFQINLLSRILSFLFIAIGVVIMILCIIKYFKQLSGLFKESKTGNLQTNGLHRWMRHPLYAGTFLFLLGLLLFWPSYKNVLAVGIIIIYTLAGAWLEEKKLIIQFGKAYQDYQSKVSMIIPRIKFRNI